VTGVEAGTDGHAVPDAFRQFCVKLSNDAEQQLTSNVIELTINFQVKLTFQV